MSFIDAFSRHRKHPDVRPGDRYCRHHGKGVVETATVVDLRNDPLGIPHVRFQVSFEREASEHTETSVRILALGAFRSTYCARPA